MDPPTEYDKDLARERWTPIVREVVTNNTAPGRAQQPSRVSTNSVPASPNALPSSSSTNVRTSEMMTPQLRREAMIHNDRDVEYSQSPYRAIDYILAQGVPPPVAQLLRSIRASDDRLREHVVTLQGIEATSSTAITRIGREISGYIAQVTASHLRVGDAERLEPVISTIDLCIALEEIIRGYEA